MVSRSEDAVIVRAELSAVDPGELREILVRLLIRSRALVNQAPGYLEWVRNGGMELEATLARVFDDMGLLV